MEGYLDKGNLVIRAVIELKLQGMVIMDIRLEVKLDKVKKC